MSDGRLKARGIELGQRAAAEVLAKRSGDGWDVQGAYEFKAGIGDYQTTPPWKGFVLQPGFAKARPFGMASPDRWRPAPPPAIDSQQYADAFNEVKIYGRLDSARRTPDQTAYAVWWMEFELGSMNRLARTLVRQRGLHLWQTARLFALLHMSIADGGVATWDAKFHYNHWRPYTAVRRAADDRNPGTEADAQWEALRPAPPFPDYPSGHAMGCGYLIRGLHEHVRRWDSLHDGERYCTSGDADAVIYELQPGGRRVLRFTGDARVSLPLWDRGGTEARTPRRARHRRPPLAAAPDVCGG